MTHDELLAKINIGAKFHGTSWSVDGLELIKQSQALRAIVELHKPIKISGEELCDACEEWTNEGANYRVYPCPTIEAIEKVLQ